MTKHNNWNPEEGLGKRGDGRFYPIPTIRKNDRKGLGSAKTPKPRVTHPVTLSDLRGQRMTREERKLRRRRNRERKRREKERERKRDEELRRELSSVDFNSCLYF